MATSHYPPYHLGGDAVFVRYLSEALSASGHEIHIVFNSRIHRLVRGKSQEAIREEDSNEDIHIYDMTNFTPVGSPLYALSFDWTGRAVNKILDLSREIRPDVVHWHNTKGLVGRPVAVPGAVNMHTAHDYYMICPRSNLLKPDRTPCQGPRWCNYCVMRWGKPPEFWRSGKRVILTPRKGVSVLSPSEYLGRRLADYGIQIHSVLRNFVPDHGFQDPIEPESRSLILYAGLLEPHKGINTMLEAFRATMEHHKLNLAIVGDGSMRGFILEWISRYSMQERVKLHGYVGNHELSRLRKLSLFQVVPSEWPENAPLTILESLAMGLPVLASDQGGIPEMAEQDAGSIVFPAGNVAELANSMMKFWNERFHASSLMKLARDAYVKRYTPEAHMHNYIRILSETSRFD